MLIIFGSSVLVITYFCKLTNLKAHTHNRHFKSIHTVFKTYIDYVEEVFPTAS